MPATGEHGGNGRSDGGTSPAEYVLGGLGAVMVLVLLVFLGYQALVVRETAPEISVEVTEVVEARTGYTVRVELRNRGGTTAEGVRIGGRLLRDGRPVEDSSAQVPYVPPASVRSAALVFAQDPRDGELVVGPTGYSLP